MEGIEPSLNVAADRRINELMLALFDARDAWKLDRAQAVAIEDFHDAAYKLWSYVGSLKTVVKG